MPRRKNQFRKKRRGRPAPRNGSRKLNAIPRGLESRTQGPTIRFWRSYANAAIDISASVPYFGAYTFYLSAVAESNDMTRLFDEYRILCVELRMITSNNISQDGKAGSVLHALDFDSDSLPGSFEALRQYGNYREHTIMKDINRRFVPCVAASYYVNSTSTGYGARASPWLDCNSPTVPHYGFLFGVNSSIKFTYESSIRLLIEFRNTR